MSNQQKIKLSIADRVYPLTIKPEQEEGLRKAAKKIEEMSWAEFREINTNEWSPGLNVPFDPVAAEYAEREDLEIVTMDGANLKNLRAYLNGEKYEGTLIKNN